MQKILLASINPTTLHSALALACQNNFTKKAEVLKVHRGFSCTRGYQKALPHKNYSNKKKHKTEDYLSHPQSTTYALNQLPSPCAA